ncbi:MAG: hypothetical protein GVY07_12620 [Bacteroidetes bacterium]|jgi:cell division septation protein DedD|nr:hypothetical protein [Bacteroidota bacterium]
MTIDKKQLVELLVEKTSMNEEEIETQLDQLIERILDAAKRGKALEIKEFGLFYFDEEGELRFDPADELSTEISFKYAGMKPVELKPERNTSISDADEEGELRFDPADELSTEINFKYAGMKPVELKPERNTSISDADEDNEEQIDEGSEEINEDPIVSSFKETEEPKEEIPLNIEEDEDSERIDETDEDITTDPFSDEALEPLEEPVEKQKEKRTKLEDIKPSSREPVKKKDNTGVFILIAIVVIAVLIGGYFYYIGTQSQSSVETDQTTVSRMEPDTDESDSEGNGLDSSISQTYNQETESSQEITDDNQASAEQAGTNQGTESEVVSNTGVSASETDQAMYGLNGSVIEEANNGYSIVVHSFRNESNAQQAAEQLRADGYRVILSTRMVYENNVWRVSVGQFETLGDAQQAITQLPAPYNNQNFIQRIRIN